MLARRRSQHTALILEDDVRFSRRLTPRTVAAIGQGLNRLPSEWMIFYLGHMTRWAYFIAPRVLRTSSTAAHAYIASDRLMHWLEERPHGTPGVARLKIAGKGIDSAYSQLPGTYAFFPLIATQDGSASDHHSVKDPTVRKLKHLFSRSRHREWIIAHITRPNQYMIVALSPIFMLWQLAKSRLHRPAA
jgi:hypothetical protein